MSMPFRSLAFSISAVVLVLIFTLWHLAKLSWLPAALIVFYTTLAYRNGKKNPSALSGSAEQAYFLGYLCTITAFVGLLLRIWSKPEAFRETQSILMTSWIALSTII